MGIFDYVLSLAGDPPIATEDPSATLSLLHGLAETAIGLCLLALAARLGARAVSSRPRGRDLAAFLAITVGLGLAGLGHVISPGEPAASATLLEVGLTLGAASACFACLLLAPRLLTQLGPRAGAAPRAPSPRGAAGGGPDLEPGSAPLARYEIVDVSALMVEVVAAFEHTAAARGASLRVVVPPATPAELDRHKLERVLAALLLRGCAEARPGDVVCCELDDSDASWLGFVVASDELDERAGDDLALARGLVEVQGGTLRCERGPGGGGRLIARFPRQAPLTSDQRHDAGTRVGPFAAAAGAHLAREARAGKDGEGGYTHGSAEHPFMVSSEEPSRPRVLVVEDNRDLNRFLCRCLGQELDVISARNGAEGLELALKERPDCVLTDVMMPVMSGEQLVTELRQKPELEGIPVVVLTARDDDQLRVKLLREGVQDFITKPFLTDEVLARVRNLVAAKRAADVLQGELATKRMDLESMAREVARHRHELQTALQQMQVARDLAERASSVKSNFLRMMSHELRTPIAAMQLQLRLMEKHGAEKLEDKQREYLARISRSAQRLLDLVNTVLEYARIESGRFEARVKPFSLTKVLREATEEFQSHAVQKGIRLTANLPDDDKVPLLASDPQVVRLIAVNLIGNGVKHTEEGVVEVGCSFEEGVHLLSVKDTGPGIPREHQMEVFEPFQRFEDIRQLQGAGSGLGLAIVRDMVRAVGGDISLESDVGKGAAFRVTLPTLPMADDDKDERASGTGSFLHH